MVLLAGPGPEGGGTRCLSSPQSPTPPRGAQTGDDDPGDYEEYEDFSSLPDTHSIASDDSFYPPGGEEECGAVSAECVPEGVPEAATLLRAACTNDVGLLRALVQRGPSCEEVQETDRNGRVWSRREMAGPSFLKRPGPLTAPGIPYFSLEARAGSVDVFGWGVGVRSIQFLTDCYISPDPRFRS
ncbi:ankyrin repeat domain-containing protein 33B isoform 3 [Cricetulus griseus]|nr:ankyrin repeat domain-containing protein 33B isoform 3 [Cricetulus griseus]